MCELSVGIYVLFNAAYLMELGFNGNSSTWMVWSVNNKQPQQQHKQRKEKTKNHKNNEGEISQPIFHGVSTCSMFQ